MSSQAQKKSGWTIPDEIETEARVCVSFQIPDKPEYRQATLGTISRLQEWFNWEKSYVVGDTRASQVAHYLREILFQTLVIVDGDCQVNTMFQLRQNPSDPCELQQSLDGGVTWSTVFDYSLCSSGGEGTTTINISVAQTWIQELNVTYITNPTEIGKNLGNSDENTNTALCHALNILVRGVLIGALERLENGNNQELVIQSIAGGIAIASAFIFGTPFAGLSTAIGVAVGLVSNAIMNQLEEEELEAIINNNAVIKELQCCAYSAIVDTKPTFTSFQNMFDNCVNLSPDAQTVLNLLQSAVDNLDLFLTFLEGASQAWTYADQGVLGNDCDDCGGTWCEVIDFTVGDGNFNTITVDAGNDGNWVSGTGWTAGNHRIGSRYYRGIRIFNTFNLSTITSIDFAVFYDKGLSDTPDIPALAIRDNTNGVVGLEVILYQDAVSGQQVVSWSGALAMDSIYLLAISSAQDSASYSGGATIQSIQICGTGSNPFA